LAEGSFFGMTDDRSDRERHAEAQRRSDIWLPGTAISSAKQLVRVYDGGSMPSTAGKVFLTHPVVADADDTEASSASLTQDVSQTIPVIVLGSATPVAGDHLIAHAVGGRWFAEYRPGGVVCGACKIPGRDLTLSWTGGPVGPGSITMTYWPSPGGGVGGVGRPLWYADLTGVDNFGAGNIIDPPHAVFFCYSSGMLLQIANGLSGGDNICGCVACPINFLITRTGYTCSPLHVEYDISSASLQCMWLLGEGYTAFYVDE
jgi:hypothetical protein